MADNQNFDVQGALDAGASEDQIFDFLKQRAPQFNADAALKAGKSKQDIINFLASNVKPPTSVTLKPFINPDINKPVRKIDKQGLDLPNRQQNDPRLIQPQDIGTDKGVIPGAQTGAGLMASMGTPLGVIGDVASPAVAAVAANAPKIKAALTGAAMGAGGDIVMGGKHPFLAALEGAATGAVGNKVLNALLKRFSPEAAAPMSEVAPTLSQPIAPGAIPGAPTSTLSPQTPGPAIQAPNNPPIFTGGGSTGPALAPPIPAPVPPRINLATGTMLKKGADTLEETRKALESMTPKQLEAKLAKLAEEQATNAKRKTVFDALKSKYGLK